MPLAVGWYRIGFLGQYRELSEEHVFVFGRIFKWAPVGICHGDGGLSTPALQTP